MSDDLYKTLGVGEDADSEEIKSAYRKKAKESHPDTSTSGKDPKDFIRVEKAYEVLSDSRKRRQYDRKRCRERSTDGELGWSFAGRPLERPFGAYYSFEEVVESWFEEGPTQYYHVLLSPREAAAGVSCPLACTLQRLCPHCEGRTFFDVFICPVCRGAGMLEGETEVTHDFPAGVRHGTTFRLRPGGAVLEVEILISPD